MSTCIACTASGTADRRRQISAYIRIRYITQLQKVSYSPVWFAVVLHM